MIYLGYFISDFNNHTNGELAIRKGLQPRTGEDAVLEDIGQVSICDALDEDFVIINQMIKYFKFGFGKASESGQSHSDFGNGKLAKTEKAADDHDAADYARSTFSTSGTNSFSADCFT